LVRNNYAPVSVGEKEVKRYGKSVEGLYTLNLHQRAGGNYSGAMLFQSAGMILFSGAWR